MSRLYFTDATATICLHNLKTATVEEITDNRWALVLTYYRSPRTVVINYSENAEGACEMYERIRKAVRE